MSRIHELFTERHPAGVMHCPLSQIAQYSKTRVDAEELDNTTFVGVDNLLPNKGGKSNATYPPNAARVTAFEAGDILLGNIRPYLKKVWLASGAGGCSGDVLAIRVLPDSNENIAPEFLYYLLSSDNFFAYNMRHAKGAKMPRGNKEAILNYRIPLPSLSVQREIVRILDQFTQLEAELEAELEARRQQYEHYRHELLTENKSVESYPLGEIADFKYGFTTKAVEAGAYRFLRITDITPWGKLSHEGPKYVADTEVVRPYVVEPGDLLMARTGATYGKTMLFDADGPAVYASFLIRIRFKQPNVLPRYYWHFSQSDLYWSQAKAMVSTGGQPQFNANALKLVQVPVPAIEEQQHVVDLLDRFDALVNDLSIGLPAELAARRKQYEYYRDQLLTFEEAPA